MWFKPPGTAASAASRSEGSALRVRAEVLQDFRDLIGLPWLPWQGPYRRDGFGGSSARSGAASMPRGRRTSVRAPLSRPNSPSPAPRTRRLSHGRLSGPAASCQHVADVRLRRELRELLGERGAVGLRSIGGFLQSVPINVGVEHASLSGCRPRSRSRWRDRRGRPQSATRRPLEVGDESFN